MPFPSISRSGWGLAASVVAGMGVVVAASVLGTVASRDAAASQERVAQLRALSASQGRVTKLLVDMETGQRGYGLTGDPRFLEPYRTAQQRLPVVLDRMDRLVAAETPRQEESRLIRRLAQEKTRFLARTLELFRAGRPAAARELVAGGEGRQVMDRLRRVTTRAQASNGREREEAEAEAERAGDRATYVAVAAALVLLALLAAMLRIIVLKGRRQRAAVAEARASQELVAQLAHQAAHDPLTGTPTRRLVEDRITQAVARTARDHTVVALLFIDFDRFKQVNDRHGHAVGDDVIVAATQRLQAALRPTDTVSRVGGDEFLVVCEDLPDDDHASTLVSAVVRRLNDRLVIGDAVVQLSASVGVVVADHSGIRGDLFADAADVPTTPPDADALIAAAEEAMRLAKKLGGARHLRYDPRTSHSRRVRATIADDLRAALEGDSATGGRLSVAYQALVGLPDGEPVGFEALARWTHPRLGAVSPAQFIPVAEETGQIGALGDLVTRRACQQVTEWNRRRRREGRPPVYVSVNCSAQQLLHPDFGGWLARTLRECGTSPEHVVVELTETVLIDSVSGAGPSLRSIADTGVRLALDDFGTGYSSLAYLRRFPFDIVKIDRSFASGIGTNPQDDAIVAAVTAMTRALGQTVVIEGIETAAQAEVATRLGCEVGQGYYFARPSPAAAVGAFLLRSQPLGAPA